MNREATSDEQLGIEWWNALSEEQRAHWLREAEFKRQSAAKGRT